MYPVIVAGQACVDLAPAFGALPTMEPGRLIGVGQLGLSAGGCVGNTGLALASLGVPTQLVANIGADELGRLFVALLASSTADTSAIRRLEGIATSYTIVIDIPGRDRAFWHHSGANAAFDGSAALDLLRASQAGPGTVLHLGYPTLLPALCVDGGTALVRLVGAARAAAATVSLDLAEVDPASDAMAVDWEDVLGRTLPAVDVVKGSVDDLVAMLPSHARLDAIGWADLLLSLGAAVALVTAGADGLYVRTASAERLQNASSILASGVPAWAARELWAPPFDVRVVTTNGAGDAAAAGFLAGLSQGHGPALCALLSTAAAAAHIAGRPTADAYRIAATDLSPRETPNGWALSSDRVYHGPRDGEA
jgi:sugar/nucleoside kinase (ribokinase family)